MGVSRPPINMAALHWCASGALSLALEAQISHHVEELEKQLHSSVSASVCKALRASWRELQAGNTGLSGQWTQVALDYSWERLNMGHWEDVSVEWREVYATAALLKALGQARSGEAKRAMEILDRGILLGAPVLDSALHKFASSLTLTMRTDSKASLTGSTGDEKAKSSAKAGKRIVFRNYKPLGGPISEDPVENKKPRVEINVHDLVSRTANVPLVDPQCRVPLVYLPPLDVFRQNYMIPHTPVVISGVLDTWPAYSARKWRWHHTPCCA